MKDKLPLPLVKEEAKREVSADEGGEDRKADGFDQPDRVDDFGCIVGRCGVARRWSARWLQGL